MNQANLTPLMKQYWEMKSLHPDKVLLFRMGDFFEMFYEDAVKAAPLLGIALTSRNKKGGDDTPMCGMPHHSVAGPINKLLASGLKVAICDQIEDPKLAKGLVKRAVTRILTPGMVYDVETLDAGRPHYLASFDGAALSFLDTSTGEAFWVQIENAAAAKSLLDLLPVAEMVLEAEHPELQPLGLLQSIHRELWSEKTDLLPSGAPVSAARLISYSVFLSGPEILKTIKPFQEKTLKSRLHLSSTVLRHLEVFQTYKGEGPGSLFHAVDRTRTSVGRRLLRQWLSFPLCDEGEISARWDQLDFWRSHMTELKRVREILGQMGDLERRLAKIAMPTCNARDLLSLSNSMEAGISALQTVDRDRPLSVLRDLSATLLNSLVDDPPLSTKQGYMIRRGLRADLDELIVLSTDAQSLLAEMEVREREATGISSLKIRYNNVFGYYIEVTNTHQSKVPSRYQRKQTLANAERYCTEELIELERKVLSAQTRRNEMESEIFEALRRQVLSAGGVILQLASACAELDVFSSLAWLSLEESYVRPAIRKDGRLLLRASRHPVVEQSVGKQFVANDIDMSPQSCLLLTGPNMAGKSTLMRQAALTSLMAQAGSFVPAEHAEIPLFDAIYTRIGASDQLSEGLSTFMVEMTETAAMLKEATSKSLVILDEVGRGTSTFDGMCLAQSILEFLLSEIRCQTLFATHYHELTALEALWPQVRNAHMTVSERGGEIRFLHTLAKGPAMKSYGVQVGELAGLPASVTRRAKQLLKTMESPSGAAGAQMSLLNLSMQEPVLEMPIRDEALEKRRATLEKLARDIQDAAISQMTPLEALNRLAQLQQSCHGLS